MPSLIVYLSEDDYDRMKRLAKKEGLSTGKFIAECIRKQTGVGA